MRVNNKVKLVGIIIILFIGIFILGACSSKELIVPLPDANSLTDEVKYIDGVYSQASPIYSNAGSFIPRIDHPDDKTVIVYVFCNFIGKTDKQRLKDTSKDIYMSIGKQLFTYYPKADEISLYYVYKVGNQDIFGNKKEENRVLSKLMLSRKTANKINWNNITNQNIDDKVFDDLWVDPMMDKNSITITNK